MDFGDLMKQAQRMSKDMSKVQQELRERYVEGTAGGGAVKIVMNGGQEVVKVGVDPEALDPDDVEMLQDLLMAAVNQALKKSKDLAQQELGKIAGGAVPPGLLGL